MESTLILLGGCAGCGKSSLAAELRRYDFVILDKDTTTKPLTEALLSAWNADVADRDSDTYIEHVRPVEYEVMLRAAFACLRSGISVVIDAPWLKEIQDTTWLGHLAEDLLAIDTQLETIWLTCEPGINRVRLSERNSARDQYKLNHWQTYLGQVEELLSGVPENAGLVLDSTYALPGQLADAALAHLARVEN